MMISFCGRRKMKRIFAEFLLAVLAILVPRYFEWVRDIDLLGWRNYITRDIREEIGKLSKKF